MTDTPENPRESNSEETLEDCIEQLTTDQIRYVVARQEFTSDKETAEALDMKPDTVWHWPPVVKRAVRLMAEDGMVMARHIRRKALAKAMLTKTSGLDSKDESIRQRVATEIIDWEMGKAQESLDLTTKGERILTDARTELQRRVDRLAAVARENADFGGTDK
jgi:hypothetical protein